MNAFAKITPDVEDLQLGTVDDRRTSPEGRPGGLPDRRAANRDRRRAPRIRTLKGAEIVWPHGVPVKCIVRNLSETGAQLEVHSPVLQNTFELVFDLDQSRRKCRVAWRKEPRMGVQFLD